LPSVPPKKEKRTRLEEGVGPKKRVEVTTGLCDFKKRKSWKVLALKGIGGITKKRVAEKKFQMFKKKNPKPNSSHFREKIHRTSKQ